jgi:hypothetical protein
MQSARTIHNSVLIQGRLIFTMGLPFLFTEKGGIQNKPQISNHNLPLQGKDTKKGVTK